MSEDPAGEMSPRFGLIQACGAWAQRRAAGRKCERRRTSRVGAVHGYECANGVRRSGDTPRRKPIRQATAAAVFVADLPPSVTGGAIANTFEELKIQVSTKP